jgi:hypothetical protein
MANFFMVSVHAILTPERVQARISVYDGHGQQEHGREIEADSLIRRTWLINCDENQKC